MKFSACYPFIFSGTLVLAGCATAPEHIAAAYVSPEPYRQYNCEQLATEALRLQSRLDQNGQRLDDAATHDKVFVGMGVVFFWPAIFFIGGTGDLEAEYARLLGEYDAVQQARVMQTCAAIVTGPVGCGT